MSSCRRCRERKGRRDPGSLALVPPRHAAPDGRAARSGARDPERRPRGGHGPHRLGEIEPHPAPERDPASAPRHGAGLRERSGRPQARCSAAAADGRPRLPAARDAALRSHGRRRRRVRPAPARRHARGGPPPGANRDGARGAVLRGLQGPLHLRALGRRDAPRRACGRAGARAAPPRSRRADRGPRPARPPAAPRVAAHHPRRGRDGGRDRLARHGRRRGARPPRLGARGGPHGDARERPRDLRPGRGAAGARLGDPPGERARLRAPPGGTRRARGRAHGRRAGGGAMDEFDFARSVTVGQYVPGTSVLHRLDPRAKLAAFVIVLAAIITSDSYIGNVVGLSAALGLVALAGIPIGYVFSGVRPIVPILVVFTVFHFLFLRDFDPTGSAVLWRQPIALGPYEFNFTVTESSMKQTVQGVVRIIALIVLTSTLTLTTTITGLAKGIETLLSPFPPLKVPGHEAAMVIEIAYRFVPTVADELERLMKR